MAHITVVQVHDPTIVKPDAKHYIHSLAISTIPRIVGVSPKIPPSENAGNQSINKLLMSSKSAQTRYPPISIDVKRDNSRDNVNDEHLETYFKSNGFFVQSTETIYENLKDMSEKMLAGVDHKGMQKVHSNSKAQRKRSLAMRRPSIIDQNVGVTGTVYMVSDPAKAALTAGQYSDEESDGSITSSRESISGSDSGISSAVDRGLYSDEVNSTIIAIDTGTNNMLLGNGMYPQINKVSHLNNNISSQIIYPKYLSDTSLKEHNSKLETCNESKADSSSEEVEDAAEPEVTLEWRVIPPSRVRLQQEQHLQQEGSDRGSTPTSFSSAYTVTNGADTESNSEGSSALSGRRWSSGLESDEESHASSVNVNERTIEPDSSEEINISDSYLDRELLSPTAGLLRLPEILSGPLCRPRYPSCSSLSSHGESIIYSYIPCRDQREKEDEELWVANEAADPRACDSPLQDNKIPPLVLPPWGWDDDHNNNNYKTYCSNGKNNSNGNNSSNTNNNSNNNRSSNSISMEGGRGRASSRHLIYSSPSVLSERSRSADDILSVPSVTSVRRATLGPSSGYNNSVVMCTLAPATAPSQVGGTRGSGSVSLPVRRHYSTRQRTVADTHIVQVQVVKDDEGPKYKHNWTKLVDAGKLLETKGQITCNNKLVEDTTNKYSCLVRSQSVIDTTESEMLTRRNLANLTKGQQKKVSASDQAILDKLNELNIKSANTATSIKPRRTSSKEPPCCRCREPVYLAERTEPTLGLIYHNQCFKCHQCSVQLSLKTFYRSPRDSKDLHVWCKSHVPSLDPLGKLQDPNAVIITSGTSTTPSSGKSTPDSALKSDSSTSSDDGRDSRCSSSPLPPLVREVDIVKCDTIGLRYF